MIEWIRWNDFELKKTYEDCIHQLAKQKLEQHLHQFLNQCSKTIKPEDHHLLNDVDWTSLIPEFSINLIKKDNHAVKTARSRKQIDSAIRCMGRTGKGTQCMRARRDATEFCKTHQHSLPHGRIDEEAPIKPKRSRRGRKRKDKKVWTYDELFHDDYIETSPAKMEVDGQVRNVLVDKNKFIYDQKTLSIIARQGADEEIYWYI